jgi:hypothetical protein
LNKGLSWFQGWYGEFTEKINLFTLSGIKKRFNHLTGRTLVNKPVPVRGADSEVHRLEILTSKYLFNKTIRNVEKQPKFVQILQF